MQVRLAVRFDVVHFGVGEHFIEGQRRFGNAAVIRSHAVGICVGFPHVVCQKRFLSTLQ